MRHPLYRSPNEAKGFYLIFTRVLVAGVIVILPGSPLGLHCGVRRHGLGAGDPARPGLLCSILGNRRWGNTVRVNRYTVILCDGSTIKADHILTCRVAEGGVLEVALRNDRTVRYSPFSWSHFEEATPRPGSRIVD